MLITPFYNGAGLGNQLACYITTRCLALDKGYEFGTAFPDRFKGRFFWNFDFGKVVDIEVPVEGETPTKLPPGMTYYREASLRHPSGADISPYDERLREIDDNTCIHGLMQGEGYFKHRKDLIQEWLEVQPIDMPDDVCVINFRGGEYVGVTDFFLPQSYWDNAIAEMRKTNPDMRFEVHTDDAITAGLFFPSFPIIQNMELNWRSIRYAKYLILSNSSFAFFPAWLGEAKRVIAPKYWGRFNTSDGYWSIDQNYTEGWEYLDRWGKISKEK